MHSRVNKSGMKNSWGVKVFLKEKIKGKLPEIYSILEQFEGYMGKKSH